MSAALPPGENAPPCAGANHRPLMHWISVRAWPNVRRSPSASAGKSAMSTRCETRITLRSGGGATHAGVTGRNGNDASPGGRHGEAGELRRWILAAGPPAALEHEPALREQPRADGGSLGAARHAREMIDVGGKLI